MASRVNTRRSSRMSSSGENNENIQQNIGPVKMGLKNTTNIQAGVKRKAESLLENNIPSKKRNVLGDVTNAIEKKIAHGRNQVQKLGLKKNSSNISNIKQNVKSNKPPVALKSNRTLAPAKGHLASVTHLPRNTNTTAANALAKASAAPLAREESLEDPEEIETALSRTSSLPSRESVGASRIAALKLSSSHDASSYATASESSPPRSQPLPVVTEEEDDEISVPHGVVDYDKECMLDSFAVATYASDIFYYYKQREAKFKIEDYIDKQPEINENMRAILVDWMVEVQESFELNHETLYLAVKLVDLYLGKATIGRDELQLVGSTALFIACKFDERTPPYIDDFLYICDDAYSRAQIIAFEMKMLHTVGFDLGVPLSYRYLRRYARCAKVSMEELTLARYILESSLLDYSLVSSSDCLLAAAALLLARYVTGNEQCWTQAMEHYSGFPRAALLPLARHLHALLTAPPRASLATVRNKYSHAVFYGVAKLPVPDAKGLQ